MASKLDIFAVLTYLDENNLGVYEALRDDPEMLTELERNVTWMLPQWMTGATNDTAHETLIESFNIICNDGWFSLYGHPELQAKLLACCGTGKRVRHKYYKPSKSTNLGRMMELLEGKYQDIREEEVAMWVRRSTKAGMVRLAESLGYQDKEVKELTKAFDTLRKG
jgi:hypothetical protein